jgi:hypothetical protein
MDPPMIAHGDASDMIYRRIKRRPTMTEKEIVSLLQLRGIRVDIGAQYSIRCQFAQVVNVIRDARKTARVEALREAEEIVRNYPMRASKGQRWIREMIYVAIRALREKEGEGEPERS